jgi:hypothetical protein
MAGHRVPEGFTKHELLKNFASQPLHSGFDGRLVAATWDEFFEHIQWRFWSDLWMYAPPLPCHSAAWAGTSCWVPVFYESGQELLIRHNGRVYGIFSSHPPLERSIQTVEVALAEFYEATERIRAATIAMNHPEPEPWVGNWEKVLSGTFDQNYVEYAKAYLPGPTDTDANRHAITCVMHSWCFGGMGWWNDHAPEREIEEVGTPYFAAQRNLIAAVGNVPIEAASL